MGEKGSLHKEGNRASRWFVCQGPVSFVLDLHKTEARGEFLVVLLGTTSGPVKGIEH